MRPLGKPERRSRPSVIPGHLATAIESASDPGDSNARSPAYKAGPVSMQGCGPCRAPNLHVLAPFLWEIGHSKGVGRIYGSVKVSREPEGPSQEVSLLVDTGATASVIPGDVLASLGVTPLRTEEFELADGRTILRRVGGAYFTFSDRTAPTLVVFGEPGDTPVLGVIALEEMGLEIDSRSGEIRRAKRLLVATRRTQVVVAA